MKWLFEKLSLSDIDYLLSISDYDFVPRKASEKGFYENTSYLNLKYVFLRNNMYIEKLSGLEFQNLEELNVLNKEQTDVFILDTYKKQLVHMVIRTILYVLALINIKWW